MLCESTFSCGHYNALQCMYRKSNFVLVLPIRILKTLPNRPKKQQKYKTHLSFDIKCVLRISIKLLTTLELQSAHCSQSVSPVLIAVYSAVIRINQHHHSVPAIQYGPNYQGRTMPEPDQLWHESSMQMNHEFISKNIARPYLTRPSICQYFLDQILSAEFLSNISKLVWR